MNGNAPAEAIACGQTPYVELREWRVWMTQLSKTVNVGMAKGLGRVEDEKNEKGVVGITSF
jgi:hypothetical protein